MLTKTKYYDPRTFLIYIDAYENDNPIGRYYNPCREESGTFKSLTQLLLQLEQVMDEKRMPQSFHTVRTFFPMMGYWNEGGEAVSPRAGRLATFAVYILFRRNASWQGIFLWQEENKSIPFRSVLELIILMDSVLHQGTDHVWPSLESDYEDAIKY